MHTKSRAQDSGLRLLARIDKMRDDPETDLDLIQMRRKELVETIDSEWSAPVLLAAWDSLRSESREESAVRPHIKNALELLLHSSSTGPKRSLSELASLVSACWLLQEETTRSAAPHWSYGEVLVEISGQNLTTAKDAEGIVKNGLLETIQSIASILTYKTNPSSVLPRNLFPHLALMPATGEARQIWRSLYLRLSLIIHTSNGTVEPGIQPISDYFTSQIYSPTDVSDIFNIKDAETLLLPPGGDMAAYPVVQGAGTLWTSSYLLLDSIAPWLLQAIEKSKRLRKRVISQAFEDLVVEILRTSGFEAGPVTDKGVWCFGSAKKRIGDPEDLAGEIDVLAIRDSDVFLLECKSIYSMGRFNNIAEKLAPSTYEWRSLLNRKRSWIEKTLNRKVDLSLIVVEGLIYYSSQEAEADPPLVPIEAFKDLIENN